MFLLPIFPKSQKLSVEPGSPFYPFILKTNTPGFKGTLFENTLDLSDLNLLS